MIHDFKSVIHIININLLLVIFSAGCQRENVSNIEVPAVLKNDSTSIEEACRAVSFHLEKTGAWKCSAGGRHVYDVIDSLSACLDSAAKNDKAAALDSVRSFIYDKKSISFVDRRYSFVTMLPEGVFANGEGGCLGVSLLFLLCAEKMDIPLCGVMLPTHFFCRYDDGETRFNIEPNLKGVEHSDEYYREQYRLEKYPVYDLRNLTPYETIGVLCYNTGNALLNMDKNRFAAEYLSEATKRLPWSPQVRGNFGIALARSEKIDSACTVLRNVYDKHPCMEMIAANFASVLLMKGKKEEAQRVVEKGMNCFPEDTVLRKIYEDNF